MFSFREEIEERPLKKKILKALSHIYAESVTKKYGQVSFSHTGPYVLLERKRIIPK
jgi:hypothetical protein